MGNPIGKEFRSEISVVFYRILPEFWAGRGGLVLSGIVQNMLSEIEIFQILK